MANPIRSRFGLQSSYVAKVFNTVTGLIPIGAASQTITSNHLNYSETVRSQCLLDIPGYTRKADTNWPEVKSLANTHE